MALLLAFNEWLFNSKSIECKWKVPEAPLCAFGRRKLKVLWATGGGLLFESLQTTGEKGLVL